MFVKPTDNNENVVTIIILLFVLCCTENKFQKSGQKTVINLQKVA